MISVLFKRQIMLLVETFVVNWGLVRRRLLMGKTCIWSSAGQFPP